MHTRTHAHAHAHTHAHARTCTHTLQKARAAAVGVLASCTSIRARAILSSFFKAHHTFNAEKIAHRRAYTFV